MKRPKAVTLMELVIAIALLAIIVLATALSQKMGLDFLKSTSSRVEVQNKANLAVEEIVREGREAESYTVSDAGRTITFDSGKSYTFGERELSDFDGYFTDLETDKRFSIYLEGEEGEGKEAKSTVISTQVNLILADGGTDRGTDATDEEETHMACIACETCVEIPGAGADECSNDGQCPDCPPDEPTDESTDDDESDEEGRLIAVEIAPGRGVFAIYDTATGLWSDEAYPLGDPRINPDKVISIEEWKENTTSSLD